MLKGSSYKAKRIFKKQALVASTKIKHVEYSHNSLGINASLLGHGTLGDGVIKELNQCSFNGSRLAIGISPVAATTVPQHFYKGFLPQIVNIVKSQQTA